MTVANLKRYSVYLKVAALSRLEWNLFVIFESYIKTARFTMATIRYQKLSLLSIQTRPKLLYHFEREVV